MIDEILGKEIIELFFLTFLANVKKGKLEIYYGDGYAEYPMILHFIPMVEHLLKQIMRFCYIIILPKHFDSTKFQMP